MALAGAGPGGGEGAAQGKGRCGSPFRYWLAEAEERWKMSQFYVDPPDLDELDGLDDELLLPPDLRTKDGEKT